MRCLGHWIIVACVLSGACARKNAEPARPVATAQGVRAPLAQQDLQEEGAGNGQGGQALTEGQHGTRRMRGSDLPVYVDGVQAGVLRYGDLPALENVGGEFAPEFRLVDYLRAIGVPATSVKSVVFFDNASKVGSIEGKELVKDTNRFVFRFAAGASGVAQTAWDTTGLKNLYVVHEIRKMAVYVAKEAPAINKARQCFVTAENECSDSVPMQAADPVKGTRVYLDGKMVGFVKRRTLGDALVVGQTDDGDPEFSLTRFANTLGVDTTGIKAFEVVAGDDVVGRGDAILWARHQSEINFMLPKHQHGKVRVHVPTDMQVAGATKDKDALATSVLLYKSTTPGKGRDLVAISEATDMSALLANSDGRDEEGGRGER